MDRIGIIEPNKNPNNSFLPSVQLLYRTIIFFNMFYRLTFRNTQIPSFYTCYLRGATFFMIHKITYYALLFFYNTSQRKNAGL